ncbi:RETINOL DEHYDROGENASE [Salix koriyanagi]|nr:RETINOL DEHYDROGENASE [Salix koriyanagi]
MLTLSEEPHNKGSHDACPQHGHCLSLLPHCRCDSRKNTGCCCCCCCCHCILCRFNLGHLIMWFFNRNGSSGFSASSTAEEVTRGIDASGLTAIVTGASSGLGCETTRVLALRGVHVIMGVRNMAAGRDVKDAIVKEIPAAKVDFMELDLSSLASVRKFASDFNSSGRPLNLLINNAGIMATPFMLSKDNIELQFATNHLGHFLLTSLLLDTMKKTARESDIEGRIVNVSSEFHRYPYYPEGIRFDKLNDQSG